VTECVKRFRQEAQTLASERRSKADRIAELSRLDPASRLLEIKVCDPAMGSGHFLVSLVDFLADRVLEQVADAPLVVPFADAEHSYELPLVEPIASIRQRILRLAADGRWKVDEAQLDDRHLVRRMILKRVVHGVDKNPMAVELAKVALWLHTFTAGAPLSFLDHHLRCGDSLLGLRLADINAWLQERGALPIHRHVVAAQGAASGMAQVERITAARGGGPCRRARPLSPPWLHRWVEPPGSGIGIGVNAIFGCRHALAIIAHLGMPGGRRRRRVSGRNRRDGIGIGSG
jgi:hypothetical protein